MKFDLIQPCKHCPFRNDETRITFACRDRAAEIEETAYRQGFPCHEHAEHMEETEYQESGFVERHDGTTQHCFGVLAMYLRDGGSSVPWEAATDDDPDLEERWWSRVKDKTFSLIWNNEEEYLEANDG